MQPTPSNSKALIFVFIAILIDTIGFGIIVPVMPALLLTAMLTLGVDYCVIGFAPTIAWLFLGRFIAGIAGATYSPAYALIADISPPDKRAQNFGLVGAAFGAGFIIGPTVGGLLGELGPRVPFFAAAAFALANFTFGFFALPETHKLENRRRFEWSRANRHLAV